MAILFGSTASGGAKPDSDVDIALLLDTPMTLETKVNLIEEIGLATGRPVDLVDLREAHGALLRQILSTGRRLVFKDPAAWADLIGRSLLERADFQPLLDLLHQTRRRRWIGV